VGLSSSEGESSSFGGCGFVFFGFPPFSFTVLLPLVALDVPLALVKPLALSGLTGPSTSLSCSLTNGGIGLSQPLLPSTSLLGAAELGEKIRSSLPVL
jgi:hypothetical protein